jgi:protein-S-isoprenylcysteine O-methyltransferase Ste14
MPITLTALHWGGRVVLGLRVDSVVSGLTNTMPTWPAEVFALVFVVFSLPIVFHLLIHPDMLRRRVRIGPVAEPEPRQRLIIALLLLCIAAMAVVTLLGYVVVWSHVPLYLVPLGDALVAAGLVLIWLVFRANPYAAATVNVETEQTVISTGPYAVVRHPMYSGGLLLFLGIPFALGIWWGLVPFAGILVLIIWRLKDEERYLAVHLPGYREYCVKVTHRLIPFIW